MGNDKKVIPFNKPFKKQLVKTTPNDMRAAATGTIAFILLLMVGFNFQVFENTTIEKQERAQKLQRGLASVPRMLEPQWKKSLKNLNQKEITTRAEKPSDLDRLTYGELKGDYSFTIQNGVVKNIHFTNVSSSKPHVLIDSGDFFGKHGRALVPSFESIISSIRAPTTEGFKEVFTIKAGHETKTVEFSLDRNNGLMDIAVQ